MVLLLAIHAEADPFAARFGCEQQMIPTSQDVGICQHCDTHVFEAEHCLLFTQPFGKGESSWKHCSSSTACM